MRLFFIFRFFFIIKCRRNCAIEADKVLSEGGYIVVTCPAISGTLCRRVIKIIRRSVSKVGFFVTVGSLIFRECSLLFFLPVHATSHSLIYSYTIKKNLFMKEKPMSVFSQTCILLKTPLNKDHFTNIR